MLALLMESILNAGFTSIDLVIVELLQVREDKEEVEGNDDYSYEEEQDAMLCFPA